MAFLQGAVRAHVAAGTLRRCERRICNPDHHRRCPMRV